MIVITIFLSQDMVSRVLPILIPLSFFLSLFLSLCLSVCPVLIWLSSSPSVAVYVCLQVSVCWSVPVSLSLPLSLSPPLNVFVCESVHAHMHFFHSVMDLLHNRSSQHVPNHDSHTIPTYVAERRWQHPPGFTWFCLLWHCCHFQAGQPCVLARKFPPILRQCPKLHPWSTWKTQEQLSFQNLRKAGHCCSHQLSLNRSSSKQRSTWPRQVVLMLSCLWTCRLSVLST